MSIYTFEINRNEPNITNGEESFDIVSVHGETVGHVYADKFDDEKLIALVDAPDTEPLENIIKNLEYMVDRAKYHNETYNVVKMLEQIIPELKDVLDAISPETT